MKKLLAPLFVAALAFAVAGFGGCSSPPTASAPGQAATVTLPQTPEAQIKAAADTHAAASTLGTVLLKNGKITVAQAKGFSALLHSSSAVLDDAGKTLFACRASTGSTDKTSPDPCAIGVADLIRLAADSIASVHSTLAAKQ